METVHTVWDFYDGPRTGIADLNGKPHYYCCQWDAASDEYSSIYALFPIDEETLQIALEQWAVWRSWQVAFHSGEVPASSHPAHGGNGRYNELERLLQSRIQALEAPQIVMQAQFEPAQGTECLPAGVMRALLVTWEDAA